MADLTLRTDKGAVTASGGPNIDTVALKLGRKEIYICTSPDGRLYATDKLDEPAPEPEPEPEIEEEPAEEDNAAVEGEDVA